MTFAIEKLANKEDKDYQKNRDLVGEAFIRCSQLKADGEVVMRENNYLLTVGVYAIDRKTKKRICLAVGKFDTYGG